MNEKEIREILDKAKQKYSKEARERIAIEIKKLRAKYPAIEAKLLEQKFGTGYIRRFDETKVIVRNTIDKLLPSFFKQEKGIILSGPVGVGKTMALIYIYKRTMQFQLEQIIKRGDIFTFSPQELVEAMTFYYAPDLFNTLHNGYAVRLRNFVFLDDFGTEYVEPFALSQFDRLIEKFYARGKYSIVITTNMMRDEFANREGFARIADRLLQVCTFIQISGRSKRQNG